MATRCCRGLDVLIGGHGLIGAAAGEAKKYLVMHIENPKGLVEKDKGAGIAWATDLLVPEFIENSIYKKVSDKLKEDFKAKGSEVSVDIVQSPPKGAKPTSDLGGGIILGVILAALTYGAVRIAA